MFTRRELDSLILDVEFVLISVVQGVALTTLAVEATHVLQMDRPRDWFGYSIACYTVSAALYFYDYALMRGRRALFERSAALRRLYANMLGQQRRDMAFFIPGGLAFNAAAYLIAMRHREAATALAWTQFALTLAFLGNLVREFSHRQRLITEATEP